MKELLEMLEEIMDIKEDTLETTTVLSELEEWDSLSKLSLMAEAKKNYQKLRKDFYIMKKIFKVLQRI